VAGKDPSAGDGHRRAKGNPHSYTDLTGLLAAAICSEIAVDVVNTPFCHFRLRVTGTRKRQTTLGRQPQNVPSTYGTC
jgi:hypothetical protein